jgi:rhodanese-related sulfurtransferase
LDAADLIAAGHAMIIDVREPSEYEAGHIKGSFLIPLGSVTTTEWPQGISDGKKVIVVCAGGVRSAQACQILGQRFPERQFYNLIGGVNGWRAAGQAIEVDAPTTSGPSLSGLIGRWFKSKSQVD